MTSKKQTPFRRGDFHKELDMVLESSVIEEWEKAQCFAQALRCEISFPVSNNWLQDHPDKNTLDGTFFENFALQGFCTLAELMDDCEYENPKDWHEEAVKLHPIHAAMEFKRSGAAPPTVTRPIEQEPRSTKKKAFVAFPTGEGKAVGSKVGTPPPEHAPVRSKAACSKAHTAANDASHGAPGSDRDLYIWTPEMGRTYGPPPRPVQQVPKHPPAKAAGSSKADTASNSPLGGPPGIEPPKPADTPWPEHIFESPNGQLVQRTSKDLYDNLSQLQKLVRAPGNYPICQTSDGTTKRHKSFVEYVDILHANVKQFHICLEQLTFRSKHEHMQMTRICDEYIQNRLRLETENKELVAKSNVLEGVITNFKIKDHKFTKDICRKQSLGNR